MRTRRITLAMAVLYLIVITGCSAPGNNTGENMTSFTDSAGREVKVPAEITKVAPSGAVATMILAVMCPEKLVSVSSTPSSSQYKYLPSRLMELPTTGQLYGSKSTINLEALIEAEPDIIIDLGDRKDSIGSDMDELEKTTGIPTVFIEADLENIAEAFRTMGELLGDPDRGEELAAFIDETMIMAEQNRALVNEPKSVMYTTGSAGLNTNAQGSIQAQVLEIVGAVNAVVIDDVSNAGGGNALDLEQVYNFGPEIILFADGSIYDTVAEDMGWQDLDAIRSGEYYEIPGLPYSWMSSPPSINMVLGVWWLGNLLYPEQYDYDMVAEAQRIYKILWSYEMSDEEVREMLENSTLKKRVG